ncbi:MAG: hypothetical protein ACMXX7_02555 [Candidatus Woesearchaeota archaeon]
MQIKQKILSGALLAIYVAILIILSLSLDANILAVFIGLLPLLLYVIAYVGLSTNNQDTKITMLILSFLLPIMLLVIYVSNQFEYLNDMDIPVIAIMQLALMLILTALIIIIETLPAIAEKLNIRRKQKIQHKQTKEYIVKLRGLKSELEKTKTLEKKHQEELEELETKLKGLEKAKKEETKEKQDKLKTYLKELEQMQLKLKDKENLEEKTQKQQNKIKSLKEELVKTRQELVTNSNVTRTLRSIEDKCKAINFVIGRVYSEKKGGKIEIRRKLHIPPVLYNSFSKMSTDFEKTNQKELLKIVKKLYARLKVLEKKENEVFKLGKSELKVKRDASGEDKIIDVLTKNDSDPVEDYYLEAKEIINRVIEYLNKEIKDDKNE